jgi:hypothetical protein
MCLIIPVFVTPSPICPPLALTGPFPGDFSPATFLPITVPSSGLASIPFVIVSVISIIIAAIRLSVAIVIAILSEQLGGCQ